MGDWKHKNKTRIVCPYCNKLAKKSFDDFECRTNDNDGGGETYCYHCHKKFEYYWDTWTVWSTKQPTPQDSGRERDD